MDPPTPRPEELPPIPPTQASSSFAPQLYDADPDLSGGLDRRPHHPAPRSHAPAPSPLVAHAGRLHTSSPSGGRRSPLGAAAGTSWESIQARIHDFRAGLPPTVPCAREVVFDDRRQRLYFLGTDPQLTGKAQSLFYADLRELRGAGMGLGTPRSRDVPALPWQLLLGKAWTAAKPEKLSKEELLLRERMRMGSAGISSFTFDEVGNVVLFAFGGSLFLAEATPEAVLRPLQLPRAEGTGPRLDPKLGGPTRKLLSFVRGRDLWLLHTPSGRERQLSLSAHRPGVSCGIPDYVTQEEFHRYTGYWWSPDGSGRILAVEVNESAVDTITLSGKARTYGLADPDDSRAEVHRYPRAGRTNATSDLVLLEFATDEPIEGVPWTSPVVVKRLWGEFSLAHRYPWIEYLPRLGWLPDGKSVYVQGLDRRQRRMVLLKLSVAEFMTEAEYNVRRHDDDVQALLNVPPLFEETSDVWINVTDILHFLETGDDGWALPPVRSSSPRPPMTPPDRPSSPVSASLAEMGAATADAEPIPPDAMALDASPMPRVGLSPLTSALPPLPTRVPDWRQRVVRFIVSSEHTGFRHLYLATYRPDTGLSELRPLTAGPWVVVDAPVAVDAKRQLVYFTAKRDTVLETHFYVASYAPTARPDQIVRLTELGYSHTVSLDSARLRFVTTYSSVRSPPRTAICQLVPSTASLFPSVVCIARLHTQFAEPPDMPVPTFFSFVNDIGLTIHGCLYLPDDRPLSGKLPVLLKVYGGPHSQLVTNDYKFPRFIQLFLAVKLGFAVVLIDGRGSNNRGVAFEAHLKYHMGTVELQDQIQGLQYLERTFQCLDLSRVAISGWSYGGYLSLMAMAQYNRVFKLAICGAPVSTWELYDTAYTERYMGLPAEQPEAYRAGSVLTYADRFPNVANRVLIVHGLIDENVHYRHTERLTSELIKHQKPYQLQTYDNERHGIRSAAANEHFETLMFHFLLNYL